METTYEPLLEQSIEIEAAPATVWALVSDLTRMPEWSPQVDSTRLRSGAERVELGVQFTNRNSQDDLVWITRGEVVRFEPQCALAFRIEENWVVWSFELEATPRGGTRLTQKRAVPEGLSAHSVELTESFMGGQEVFTAQLRTGMAQTLSGIRAAAEGRPPRVPVPRAARAD